MRFKILTEPYSSGGQIHDYALACDEMTPTWAEHFHAAGCHVFPCSIKDLLILRDQIDAELHRTGIMP